MIDRIDAMRHHRTSAGLAAEMEAFGSKNSVEGRDESDNLHYLGIIAYRRGEMRQAETLFRQAISKAPQKPNYYNDLGVVLKKQNELTAALTCFQKVVQLTPNSYEANCTLAETFHRLKNAKKAEAYYMYAIHLHPGYFKAHFNLALLYHETRQLQKAVSFYLRAITLDPEFVETYYYLGCAYHDGDELKKAVYYYQKAIDLRPSFFDAHNNMGNVYLRLKQDNKASQCFGKALAINPQSASVHVNLGNTFQEQGQYRKAIQAYKNALKISPWNEVAFLNMGITLMSLNKVRKARSCYQRAHQINPKYAKACAYLVNRLFHECSWKNLADLNRQLDNFTRTALINNKVPVETPFQNITRHADPKLNLQVSTAWSRSLKDMTKLNHLAPHLKGPQKSMIRIGYLSNTFANHPGSHLISGIFRSHDRSEFEIFSFSYGPNDGSYYRKRVEQESDRFFDISRYSDAKAANLIRDHRIDILVDLRGFTHANRLSISALRPAPIHVVYLGYPGTTGADFIDYIIADKVVVPREHAQYFSERIVYMPHCYQANDNTQRIADRQFHRSEFNIPEDAFAYCSFSTHYKIEPVMFDCWMRILKSVPQSVLCLLEGGNSTQRNLRKELVNRNVDEKRLIFVKKMPKDEHLKRLQLFDLSLDTRIYNGHTTTSDALWAGIPVLTLKGEHFASRVSASILQAIGMPELITYEISEYEKKAVEIGRSDRLLKRLKEKIDKNRLVSPLFDTPRFTKNLERAYKEMVMIYQSGEAPRQIEIKEMD